MSNALKFDPPNEQAKTEIIAAEGLRASHEIITALEKCKSSSEHILDQLPDILVIMTLEGRILKGNLAAAGLLEIDPEYILNKNLYDVFQLETRNILRSRITSLLKDREVRQLQFELPIITRSGTQKEHLWTISVFSQISDRRGPLIKVLGKDISKIKEFEKKLSQIFSAIPLGIFTVDINGEIEWPYSLFTEYLLGQDKLAGKKLDKILFEPIWATLDSIEKTGASQVVDCIGGDTLWFDMAKLHFPKEIQFTRETPDGIRTCWLGITYHPIVHENTIEKIMIVLEDRTEVVEARRALELQREVENNKIKKILQIQNCSGSLLEVTFSDFDLLFPRLQNEIKHQDIDKVARTLHGIKGIARTAGFSDLEHHVHEIEDQVLESIRNQDRLELAWLEDAYDKVRTEWSELRSLCFALSGKQHGLQIKQIDYVEVLHELTELQKYLDDHGRRHAEKILEKLGGGKFAKEVELSTLEQRLKKQAAVTAEAVDRNVHLDFKWQGVKIIQNELLTFSEIFIHLLNNSIDHGIEDQSERLKQGKAPEGKICFYAKRNKDHIHFEISDDGRGIDSETVIKLALEREIITDDQAKFLNEQDILSLILAPGFTSKKEVTKISGRGIGLDSVHDAVKALGCLDLQIESEKGKGTKFIFDIPLTTID
ncbi:MAG: ATP-binding protein [Oligoflexus sp.]